MTNGETTPATTNDGERTTTIHPHVAARERLPAEHVLASG